MEDVLIEVMWDTCSKVEARLRVPATSSLRQVHEKLLIKKRSLDGQDYVYMYQGKPVFREFWDVFQAQQFEPTLIMKAGHFRIIDEKIESLTAQAELASKTSRKTLQVDMFEPRMVKKELSIDTNLPPSEDFEDDIPTPTSSVLSEEVPQSEEDMEPEEDTPSEEQKEEVRKTVRDLNFDRFSSDISSDEEEVPPPPPSNPIGESNEGFIPLSQDERKDEGELFIKSMGEMDLSELRVVERTELTMTAPITPQSHVKKKTVKLAGPSESMNLWSSDAIRSSQPIQKEEQQAVGTRKLGGLFRKKKAGGDKSMYKALALFSYKARSVDQLSFKKGDFLYIMKNKKRRKWLFAIAGDSQGWIPENFVKVVEE